MLHVLGVRHHGPGSTYSMLKALAAIEPDCILLELPVNAESVLAYVNGRQLSPPVALLIYNPKSLQEASYYPFAHFSPEWQAILFAQKKGIKLQAIDIPAGSNFKDLQFLQQKTGNHKGGDKLAKDPLGYLGQLAGYKDGERWWDAQFEQTENTEKIFPLITEMIAAIRSETANQESPLTLLREAYMRKVIRKTLKAGYQNIAVVCGAWHAPVLANWQSFTQKSDNAIVKGLKKPKTAATWVPWSYDQLAPASGYGAGVISPAWYELLYSDRSTAVYQWMIRAARFLRQKKMDASTANVIEAIRLTETLASLREKTIAGIEELEEAAIAVFCKGNRFYLDLIREKLIIGDKIGKVGPNVPKVPLMSDLEKAIKSARLTKEWETTESVRKDLDLRKPSNLAASHLIHRLNILGIKWGKLRKGSRFKLGSFQEHWTLKRRTDHAMKIVAAARWGNTIEKAAEQYVVHQRDTLTRLAVLSELIDEVLKADLPQTIPALVARLKFIAAKSKDVLELIEALPKLVKIARYGNTRQTDVEAIFQILEQIIPRICIGITNSCIDIDDDLARKTYFQILSATHSIGLLNQPSFNEDWYLSLRGLANTSMVHPMIKGLAIRLLFDKGGIGIDEAGIQLESALSIGQDSGKKALWIEGFLSGSAQLLIYNPSLWALIDNWITGLSYAEFNSTLPLLRRTFSNFSSSERRQMLQLAKNGVPAKAVQEETLALPKKEQEKALRVIEQILRF